MGNGTTTDGFWIIKFRFVDMFSHTAPVDMFLTRREKLNMKYRITFNAPVVLGIVGISLVATMANYMTLGAANELLFSTYHSPILSPLTWIRAFTHIFGHGDWTHFIGNMSYLLLLGPMLEEKYGSSALVFVAAVTALSTSVVNYLFFPYIALCGASGVVFAFILLSSFTSFKEGEIPLTFILVAVFFLGQQVWEGFTVRDDISNMGHIIGGVVGGLSGYAFNVKTEN